MIRIVVKEPTDVEWGHPNAYVNALSAWQEWANGLGLEYLRAGSLRTTMEPGQWFIQSNRPIRQERGRHVCFHEDDRFYAMMFKLVWA